MENILAKLYLLLVFLILFGSALFLALQIQLTQKLEKNVNIFRSKKNSKSESYKNSFKLGQIYLRKKIYTQAIEEFRACLIQCDRNDRLAIASLLNTLGFTYNQLGEYNLALQYYSTALLLEPGYITCQNNVAYVYANRLTRQSFFDWEKVFEASSLNPFSDPDTIPPQNIEDAFIPIYKRLTSSTYNTTNLKVEEFYKVFITVDSSTKTSLV
jgi:tetratricopeptide (TPR) repeat protein